MERVLYRTSAPGSLMLLGEHSVLQGKKAIVIAINKAVHLTLIPRTDLEINIRSGLGEYTSRLSEVSISQPFEFVTAAIEHFQSKCPSGFDLVIESDIPKDYGLGSSAAVTVASLAILAQFTQTPMDKSELLRRSRVVIQSVQGLGSGADAAASLFGGVIGYQMDRDLPLHQFSQLPSLQVVYSGFKTPTAVVIDKVMTDRFEFPKAFEALDEAVERLVERALDAFQVQDWTTLGRLMQMQQGIMDAMGVGLPILSEIVYQLSSHETIYGAKISGSGLGDCVIGLGELSQFLHPSATLIPLEVSKRGLCYE